jgi:hypothetical protein
MWVFHFNPLPDFSSVAGGPFPVALEFSSGFSSVPLVWSGFLFVFGWLVGWLVGWFGFEVGFTFDSVDQAGL